MPDIRYRHVTADLTGIAADRLRDAALLSGLLIAAAGAAGFPATGVPVARSLPNEGVTALLFLERAYMAVHSDPERGLLLLDVVTPDDGAGPRPDVRRALDVFARRLEPVDVRSAERARG